MILSCENCDDHGTRPILVEVGGIGKSVQVGDMQSNYGVLELKLYQCPQCKTVTLNHD